MSYLFKYSIVTLLFLLSTGHAYAGISIEATVDPDEASVGEPLELTVTISGAELTVEKPILPDMEHFRSYSQGHSEEISFENGIEISRSIYTFVLIPNTVGSFSIQDIEVRIGEKTYKTRTPEILVLQSQKKTASTSSSAQKPAAKIVPPSSRSLPPEFMTSEEIFVRAWTDRDSAYINQPVHLTYTLYTRATATFKGFEEEPNTKGFWVEEFPPRGLTTRHEKNIGRYRYVIADVRTLALFPTQEGEYTVTPGVLKVDVEIQEGDPFRQFYSRDIFGRRRRQAVMPLTKIENRILQTESIHVDVKPFPEIGKPEEFNGAVGHYSLETSVDTYRVEQGQTLAFQLRVWGQGNLNTVELPSLTPVKNAKYYDGPSSLNLSKERLVVEGEKIVETYIVPLTPGPLTLPVVRFAYFDPREEKYIILESKEIELHITKAEGPDLGNITPYEAEPISEEFENIAEDIQPIKNYVGKSESIDNPLFVQKRYWIYLGSPLLVALFMLIIKIIHEKLHQDLAAVRLRRAYNLAKRRLKKAKSHLKSGHEKKFYEMLSRAIHGYFADKLNKEPSLIGQRVLEMEIKPQVSEENWRHLKNLLDDIDRKRFSKTHIQLSDMKLSYSKADSVLALLEKNRSPSVVSETT